MILAKVRSISQCPPNTPSAILIYLFLLTPFTTALNFSFPSFDPNSNGKMIKLKGNAFYSSQGIGLTKSFSPITSPNYGQAIYYQPFRLWDKHSQKVTHFITHFSFIINSKNSSYYGDGLAFFLSAVENPIDDVAGSSLGLLNRNQTLNNATKNHIVAVEFDTFRNEWDPLYKEHVGIDINTLASVNSSKWSCSVRDGRRNEAWVSYNFITKLLWQMSQDLKATVQFIRVYHIM